MSVGGLFAPVRGRRSIKSRKRGIKEISRAKKSDRQKQFSSHN